MSDIFWSLAVPPEQHADDGIRGIQRELDLRAAHPDDYGYVAFVLRVPPGPAGQTRWGSSG